MDLTGNKGMFTGGCGSEAAPGVAPGSHQQHSSFSQHSRHGLAAGSALFHTPGKLALPRERSDGNMRNKTPQECSRGKEGNQLRVFPPCPQLGDRNQSSALGVSPAQLRLVFLLPDLEFLH